MRNNRVWIEILLLGTAVACALALLIATLGAAAGAAAVEEAARQQETQSTDRANLRRHGDLLPLRRQAFRRPRPNGRRLRPHLRARRSELRPGRSRCDLSPRWRLRCSGKACRTASPHRGRIERKNNQDFFRRLGKLIGHADFAEIQTSRSEAVFR